MVPRVKIRTSPNVLSQGSPMAAAPSSSVSAISSSLRPRVIQGTPAISSSVASPQVRPRPLKNSLAHLTPPEPEVSDADSLSSDVSNKSSPSLQTVALREAAQAFIDLHQHLLLESDRQKNLNEPSHSSLNLSDKPPLNPPVLTDVVDGQGSMATTVSSSPSINASSASSLMAKSFELLFNRYIDSHQNLVVKPLLFLLSHRGVLSLAFLHIFMPFIMMYALVHWSAPLYYFFFFPTALDQWMKWVVLYISCLFTWSLLFVTSCSVGDFLINREVDRRMQERRRLIALRKKQKIAQQSSLSSM